MITTTEAEAVAWKSAWGNYYCMNHAWKWENQSGGPYYFSKDEIKELRGRKCNWCRASLVPK